MTDAETLEGLAEEAEAAKAGEQYEILMRAWFQVNGDRLLAKVMTLDRLDEWTYDKRCFERMLECGAYESAAMTLVPEGHFWSITMRGREERGFHACCLIEGPMDWHDGANAALALTAAALRARAFILRGEG